MFGNSVVLAGLKPMADLVVARMVVDELKPMADPVVPGG